MVRYQLKSTLFYSGSILENNIDLVKEMLPQAEVYVYENDCQIEGFIGLNDEYMEGILSVMKCSRRV